MKYFIVVGMLLIGTESFASWQKETVVTNCLWDDFDSFNTRYKEGIFTYVQGFKKQRTVFVEYYYSHSPRPYFTETRVKVTDGSKVFTEKEEDGDRYTLARTVRTFLDRVKPDSRCE